MHEHESEHEERSYTATVEQFLTEFYGADNVERLHTLPSGRRPDFRVQTPLQTLYVEVEPDGKSTVHGAGQAVQHAGEGQISYGEQASPVVVAPRWGQPEKEAIQQYVKTYTVPTDYTPGDLQPDVDANDVAADT
jgi:hypothetical protein